VEFCRCERECRSEPPSISLGAVGDQNQAEFLPVLPQDTPVRWRASCGTLTAMKPHRSSVSAEGKDLHNSRSPAMRNARDAFISSLFRYPADQLTVFPGAGIAANFLPSEIPSKSFAWRREAKIMA